MPDKASIIIRTIGNKDIENAIKSVSINSYEKKEIIIVYQGIDNEYIKYLNTFSDKYINIEFKIVNNRDISSDLRAKNLNLGLKSSTGRYICFLDSDDEICQNHLTDLISAIKKENKAWSVGNVSRRIIENGKTLNTTDMKSGNIVLKRFYYKNSVPINSYVIDKESIKCELLFRENMVLLEDYAFILDTFIKNNLFPAIVDKIVANYNIPKGKTILITKRIKAYYDIVSVLHDLFSKKYNLPILFWKLKIIILILINKLS